jgi:glycolate oxidase iron-sulfur subunit
MLAQRAIEQINPFEYDAIISNAGGCGSHLRAYRHLLQDDPDYAERAAEWSRKLKDIHEFLVEIEFEPPQATATTPSTTVTYHESCHLCHGQKVSKQPRQILKSIPGVQVTECAESNWCCGSAGIYNITHPDTSARLLQRKLNNISQTQAGQVATANPGCHLQIENGLTPNNLKQIKVTHPIVLLDQAYRNNELL